jgi:hypothetical protein
MGGFVNKSLIFIVSIFYVGYFVKFGSDFSQTNMSPLKMLLTSILLPILAYITHDSFFLNSSIVAKSDTCSSVESAISVGWKKAILKPVRFIPGFPICARAG